MIPGPGSGQRFQNLKSSLAKKPGVYNPVGLAAAIGRKKYGSAAMGRLAHHENPYQKAIQASK